MADLQLGMFPDTLGAFRPLAGTDREAALAAIRENHYSHTVPSGKTHAFRFMDAIVLFSIPANRFAARPVLGQDGCVWELTRLWAPDGHPPNLLTQAISHAVRGFAKIEREVEALVSYADPNVGHEGYIYRAASWVYLGRCDESRYYRRVSDGQVVARRSFHSGDRHLNKDAILALGYEELKLPGKHRYARGLTPLARRIIQSRAVGL